MVIPSTISARHTSTSAGLGPLQIALSLAPPTFLDAGRTSLARIGVSNAIRSGDIAPIFDWLMTLVPLQGISDAVAFAYAAEHGGITGAEVDAGLDGASCPRLRSYWHFEGCGYRKGAVSCSESGHIAACPLPRHPLRKGTLNQAAYSLNLFIRDVCGGDIVSWIDRRLADADPGSEVPDRGAMMRAALIEPLANVYGFGPKLWSMMLADLLLTGDPDRERWCATGAWMIAVDTLVHNFLHRTGLLRRYGGEHPYGPGCYASGGCASVIEGLAQQIDARAYDPAFPAVFPRFVQFAIWHFCAAGGLDICNGNRFGDGKSCANGSCIARGRCAKLSTRNNLLAAVEIGKKRGKIVA